MKLIALAGIAILGLGSAFTALLSQQDREVSAFRQRAAEDAVLRRLMLEQLDRDRDHVAEQLAAGRAALAVEGQFLDRYNDFREEVNVMMRGVQEHKTDLKASQRVDKAWRKWRGDPGWPGPRP